MPLSPNLRGSLFMVVSMIGFTTNDALVKLATEHMSFGQVMFVRGMFATVLIGLLGWYHSAFANWRDIMHPIVGLRIIGELGATLFFLAALSRLPLANVSAILQALPLAVTMAAALFFGETVGWRRWLAIAAGFTGVMIIVRPGAEGFNVFALLVLISVVFCAIRDLATKRIPDHIPSLLVSAVTAIMVTIAGAFLIIPLGGWVPMNTEAVGLNAMAAVLVVVGYQFIIMAMRVGEISAVAPFRYTALLWAIFLGYLIFGDLPDAAMIIGSIIIVGSGLYTLYRDRVVGRSKAASESTGPNMAPDGI
ncbi:DMT family transporter [Mesorhizobium sp. SB112]|uniref:DMT family transporter n=1 Tax=Mesorhizobium sp. SB112 TaxID=3151853 RepID=UPI003264E627